jgi:uncharacterized membrane protein YhfC
MILGLYALSYLLMLGMPIALGVWVARRRGAGWALFGMGALTFVASQVLHIPFNWLVLQRWQLLPTDTAVTLNLVLLAAFLGLSAGVFEEGARYVTYRWWAKDARTWGRGLMLGAGHGGVESILLGLLAALNVGALAFMRGGLLLEMVPAEQIPLLEQAFTAVFDAPWYMALFPAAERLFAICVHLALALLVMQSFVRGQLRWLGMAILWHAAFNFVAVFAVVRWGAVVAEGLLGVAALLSVGLIVALRAPEPPALAPLAAVEPAPRPLKTTGEMLDRSRYL